MNWIDAKDKLPEKDGGYLVLWKIYDKTYYEVDVFSHGEFNDPKINKRITHWMPLPDLPPCNCGFQHHPEYDGHNQ
jgi:hypothetical protein